MAVASGRRGPKQRGQGWGTSWAVGMRLAPVAIWGEWLGLTGTKGVNFWVPLVFPYHALEQLLQLLGGRGESRGCGLLGSGWLALGEGWTLKYPLPRHWQDLGYMILYITGRPDMQKQRVVSWLSQHNFPQGMIFFSDGLVHDPLRQKAIFLRNLMQEVSVRRGRGFGQGGVSPWPPSSSATPPPLTWGEPLLYPTCSDCPSGCPVGKAHSCASHWSFYCPAKCVSPPSPLMDENGEV